MGTRAMENKNKYPPPIIVTEGEGKIHISYDQVEVDFPEEGPAPEDAPPLACRIFKALMSDLPGRLRAE